MRFVGVENINILTHDGGYTSGIFPEGYNIDGCYSEASYY